MSRFSPFRWLARLWSILWPKPPTTPPVSEPLPLPPGSDDIPHIDQSGPVYAADFSHELPPANSIEDETPNVVNSDSSNETNYSLTPPQTTPPPQSHRRFQKHRYFDVSIADLVHAGFLHTNETLFSTRKRHPAQAAITRDGMISFGDAVHDSLTAAGRAVYQAQNSRKKVADGWNFWAVRRDGLLITLFKIREQYLASLPDTPEQLQLPLD